MHFVTTLFDAASHTGAHCAFFCRRYVGPCSLGLLRPRTVTHCITRLLKSGNFRRRHRAPAPRRFDPSWPRVIGVHHEGPSRLEGDDDADDNDDDDMVMIEMKGSRCSQASSFQSLSLSGEKLDCPDWLFGSRPKLKERLP